MTIYISNPFLSIIYGLYPILPVVSEVVLSSEGFLTDVAGVGPLISVGPLVNQQIIAFGEVPGAVLAYELLLRTRSSASRTHGASCRGWWRGRRRRCRVLELRLRIGLDEVRGWRGRSAVRNVGWSDHRTVHWIKKQRIGVCQQRKRP